MLLTTCHCTAVLAEGEGAGPGGVNRPTVSMVQREPYNLVLQQLLQKGYGNRAW